MDGCIGLQWELEVGGGELRMRDGLSVVAAVACAMDNVQHLCMYRNGTFSN